MVNWPLLVGNLLIWSILLCCFKSIASKLREKRRARELEEARIQLRNMRVNEEVRAFLSRQLIAEQPMRPTTFTMHGDLDIRIDFVGVQPLRDMLKPAEKVNWQREGF